MADSDELRYVNEMWASLKRRCVPLPDFGIFRKWALRGLSRGWSVDDTIEEMISAQDAERWMPPLPEWDEE